MVLSVHTDALYLSEPGGKNKAAGHFYLSNCIEKDFNNGAVLTLLAIIKHIMLLASKAELSTSAASLLLHIEPHSRNLATSSQLPLLSPPTTSLPKA
jgi:hypothetical protein